MNRFMLIKQANVASAAAGSAAKRAAGSAAKRAAGSAAKRAAGGAAKRAAGSAAKSDAGSAAKSALSAFAATGLTGLSTGLGQRAGKKGVELTVRGLKAVAKRLGPKPTLSRRVFRGAVGVIKSPGAKRIGKFGAGAAGIAGGMAAIDALRTGLSRKVSDKKQFANIMKENPSLGRDREHALKVFKTLKRFNPDMAADPLVAGSFLKRSLQYKDEGIQPMDVKTLTEIGKNMRDRGDGSFLGKIFGDVATAKGLAGMVGG